jgi:hypothetical protein
MNARWWIGRLLLLAALAAVCPLSKTGLAAKADYELILTEIPDPGGKATCFRLRDFSAAVQDELFTLGSR